MTDVVATPPAVVTAKIDDFITAYAKQATLKDGIVVLAHSGDAVTLTIKAPYTKATFRHKQTERINRSTEAWVGGQASGKEDVPHDDNLYTLDAATPSKTVVNDNEKTVTTDKYDKTFYDFNHYITLETAFVTGADGKEQSATVAVVKPPEPPVDVPAFPWWIVGVGVTIAVIAVIVIYLWKRGRPVAMPSPGVAAAPAPAPVIIGKVG